MKRLGPQKRTHRGFKMVEFKDRNDTPCSLQASSLAEYMQPGISAVWLGTDDAQPKILEEGKGWIPYPIPAEVLLSTRMHLNRKQVAALIRHLQAWLDNGSFVVK